MSSRVYTKTGDKGTTALIGGKRVPKDHIRIEAYGTVDELNSFLGLITDQAANEAIGEWIQEVQDRLFTLESELATDPVKGTKMKLPDLHESDITWLEEKIDFMEDTLPPLKSFILPGGHVAASTAHVARCVCRRAERICVHMQLNDEPVSELVLKYLNRLSDFLFVLSRYIVHLHNGKEVLWKARI
jgi:cob(I)alamin adenosyltransferase